MANRSIFNLTGLIDMKRLGILFLSFAMRSGWHKGNWRKCSLYPTRRSV